MNWVILWYQCVSLEYCDILSVTFSFGAMCPVLHINGNLCARVKGSLTNKAHKPQQPPVEAINSFEFNTNLVNLSY